MNKTFKKEKKTLPVSFVVDVKVCVFRPGHG